MKRKLTLFLSSIVLMAVITILTFSYPTFSSIYDQIFSSQNLNVQLTFGNPSRNSDGCSFENLVLTSSDSSAKIRMIQISYSDPNSQNHNIVAPSMSGFETEADNNTNSFISYTVSEGIGLESVQEFLRGVKFSFDKPQDVTILLSSTEMDKDTHYYPETGHFYKHVSNGSSKILWTDAYRQALASSFGGWQGYLAVVTSPGENEFIFKYSGNSTGGNNFGWFGGTRAVLNNINTSSISISNSDTQVANRWYWACGPELLFVPNDPNWQQPADRAATKEESEAGTYLTSPPSNYEDIKSIFYNKAVFINSDNDSIRLRYLYNEWRDGEPSNTTSNYADGEYAVTTFSQSLSWNDANNESHKYVDEYKVKSYVIEYGDRLYGNSEPLANSLIANGKVAKPVLVEFYDNNGGSNNKHTETLYYGMKVSDFIDELYIPQAQGKYKLKGWYTDPTGGNQVNITLDSNMSDIVDEDVTELKLYAHWEKSPDATKPDITMTTTQDNKPYDGEVTINNVHVEVSAVDPEILGEENSGLTASSYYISLDDGASYLSATNPPSAVSNVNINQDSSNFSFEVSSDGNFILRVKVIDDAGNAAISDPKVIKIDRTPPEAPNITNVKAWYNSSSVSLECYGETGATLTAKKDNNILKTLTFINSEKHTISLEGLPQGQNTVEFTQTDAVGNTSQPTVIQFGVDTEGPTGKIVIKENHFTSFLNIITFGMFFKENVDISFEASDSLSGVNSVEYLISEQNYDSESIVLVKNWTKIESGNSFNIEAPQDYFKKFIVYMKITDNALNQIYINSSGVVLYRDSAHSQTNISFTKTSTSNVDLPISFNGNTINKIINKDHNPETPLTSGKDYAAYEQNGKITFNATYLDALPAGDYQLEIHYNPAGLIYDDSQGVKNNEEPSTTSLTVSILKASQASLVLKGYSQTYTYGDSEITLSVTGGSGTGEYVYSIENKDGKNVASIDKNKVTILGAGQFEITATKLSDENYSSISVKSGTINVNPRIVTIQGLTPEDKIYDGTTTATIIGEAVINSKLPNDDLMVKMGTANFLDKSAGNNKEVVFSGFSLEGGSIANYSFESQPESALANITPRLVTVHGIGSQNKIYDSTSSAAVTGMDQYSILNKIENDDLILLEGTANFEDKNVEEGKIINFSGFYLSGNDAKNYTLAKQPESTYADITKKSLTLKDVYINEKKYDGLNTATFKNSPVLEGVISGDDILLVNGTPTFSKVEVGNNIPINFEEFTLLGADSKNYSIVQPLGITSNILQGFSAQKDINYTTNTPNGTSQWYTSSDFEITAKEGYLLSTNNVDEGPWTDSLVFSEDTKETEIKFYVRDINTKEISEQCLQTYKKDSALPTGTIEIRGNSFKKFLNTATFGLFFKSNVDVVITCEDELSGISEINYLKSENVYENGSQISPQLWESNSKVNGGTLTFSVDPSKWEVDKFNDKFYVYAKIIDNAGNITYLRSDGVVIYTDSAVSTQKIEYTKTKLKNVMASVNLNGNTISKIFNDSYELVRGLDYKVKESEIEFEYSYLDTLPQGEYTLVVHYNPANESYVDSQENESPLTTSINLEVKKSLENNLKFSNTPNKFYTYGDGRVDFSVEGDLGEGEISLSSSDSSVAKVEGNSVLILKVGNFTVTATKEADENYNTQTLKSEVITVLPKPVTLEGAEVKNKIYDGNNTSEISKIPLMSYNIDGENVYVVSGNAFFDNKNASKDKLVMFTNFSLAGSRSENYVLASQPLPIRASIFEKEVQIEGLNLKNKIYDSTVSAEIFGEIKLKGCIDEDDVGVKLGSGNFEDKNVGEKKVVKFSGFELIGSESSNYVLSSQPEDGFADILKKDVNIMNVVVNSKFYDKTTAASLKGKPYLSDTFQVDNVYLSGGVPSFKDANVGDNKEIIFTEFFISGTDSSNYTLSDQPKGVTSNINPKELTISNLKIKDKLFNGYKNAEYETIPKLSGVLDGDDVKLIIGIPWFSSKESNGSIPIIFNPEFDIEGKDVLNYVLIQPVNVTANINASNIFNSKDEATGLWAIAPEGVLPVGARLVVKKLDSANNKESEEVIKGLDENKKDIIERINLFEIHFENEKGEIVQPNIENGLVTVRIPVPENFDKSDLEVYRIILDLPDAEFDEQVVKINDKYYCEFQTDHFSPYALIDKDNKNENTIMIISFIILLIFLIILLLIYIYHKAKKKLNNDNT